MALPAEHAAGFVVFVSYCGSDSDFAEELIDSLSADGRFTVTSDPDTSIDEKDWKARIGALIEAADAVVVVLSPLSASTCEWEVEQAAACSKRIVPVQCKPLGGTRLPGRLSGLEAVDFSGRRDFSRSFDVLTSKLNLNADWLNAHTLLLVKARQWEDAGYPYHLLLSPDEVMSAKLWSLSRPDGAPKPTDLHITYVCVSEAVHSAAHVANAEREEAEVVALLAAADSGGGFLRRTNKALLAAGCALLVLIFASSSSLLVAKCRDAASGGAVCALLSSER